MSLLELRGCTPEPLGNYLKALGVFRLVAEQADSRARAWWQGGVFHLLTSNSEFTNIDEFADWLLNQCQFSPFVAPWQTGTGYLPLGKRSKGSEALNRMLSSEKPAFQRAKAGFREYAEAIGVDLSEVAPGHWVQAVHTAATQPDSQARELCKQLDSGRQGETLSHVLLRNSTTQHTILEWLDAVGSVVLTQSGSHEVRWFSLLASGGGEASGQYIVNLQQRFVELLDVDPDVDLDVSRQRLLAALAGGQTANTLQGDAMGAMYFPSLMKNFNSGQRFASKPDRRVNPWDFVLLLEGTLLWASAATRRQWVTRQFASFPFYCRASLGGAATLAAKEVSGAEGSTSQGELWCPVWSSPASMSDIRRVFSEGRAQLGEKTCGSSLEFVRAVARFGVERGISAFVRYSLIERSGSGTQTTLLAVPLGTWAPLRVQNIELLDELDDFREQVERFVQPHSNQPRRIVAARIRMEQSVFDFAQQTLIADSHDKPYRLLEVLSSVAMLERELAATDGSVKLKRGQRVTEIEVGPIEPLSSGWLHHTANGEWSCPTDDGTAEFRIARAVATICPWGQLERDGHSMSAVESLRENLARVTRRGRDWIWDSTSRSAVWSEGLPLVQNLAHVLQRRLIDASRGRGEGLPLWSPFGASFRNLLELWTGQLDESRVAELVQAISLIDVGYPSDDAIRERQVRTDPTPDLTAARVWFDLQDEAHVHSETPLWRGRPLLNREDLEAAFALPRAFALLKLCFLGGRLPARPVEGRTTPRTGEEPSPPTDSTILRLLLAGRTGDALARAAAALRAKGYPPVVPEIALRSGEFILSPEESHRLAGLLLVPVRNAGVLASLVIKQSSN